MTHDPTAAETSPPDDATQTVHELTPAEVAQLRRGDPSVVLLDCRLPREHAMARLDGAVLVPMHEMSEHLESLRRYAGRRIVVYCHHGIRSLKAAAWLRQQGFAGACSMAGGIERWSKEVDASVPRY
jgi:rhodanese-related sulfurtransferase